MTQPPSQQPALPERVLAGAGAALLAAHVGGELADVALGTALGAPRAYFVSPAAACAVAAYALALPRGPWSDLLAQRTHYLIAFAALAWWASVLPTFALAFAATPLIGWWVFLADARGLVRYEVHDASFYVTRGTGYALMRAAPQAAVVHLGLDPRLARLVAARRGHARDARHDRARPAQLRLRRALGAVRHVRAAQVGGVRLRAAARGGAAPSGRLALRVEEGRFFPKGCHKP